MEKKITSIIKSVLSENDQKTALEKLCREFENLGYEVRIDGMKVFPDPGKSMDFRKPLTFSLYDYGVLKQEFSIRFPK